MKVQANDSTNGQPVAEVENNAQMDEYETEI
jgi:hypothetical protein